MNPGLPRDAPVLRVVPAPGRPLSARRELAISALVVTLAAFAIRAPLFGDPLLHWDESFYLLVGDRILHGALPYVDIWDRKPIGLFLLYAAIRLLGGGGIVQYQVVATLFAAATALIVARTSRLMTSLAASLTGGIVYLLMLGTAGGFGGQSPVFYNLFTAGAALLIVRTGIATPTARPGPRAAGVAAMLLIGIAMQIKYSVVFEGVFLGLVLLVRSWRRDRDPARTLADALLFASAALAPTAIAWLAYAGLGHAHDFAFANFYSIGERRNPPAWVGIHRLARTLRAIALPMIGVALAMILAPWKAYRDGPAIFRFTSAWLGAALFGYLVFGTYFNHYILPAMLPLAICLAPVFAVRARRIGAAAATVLIGAGAITNATIIHRHETAYGGGKRQADAIVAAIRPNLRGGCLYIQGGFAMPYFLTDACIPTRFAFPGHLNQTSEAGAIGVDQLAEIRRIMASRPTVVVDMVRSGDEAEAEERPDANALFRSYLPGHYAEVARVPNAGAMTIVYRRIG